jgi:uncharacterized membrane protein HdeD (DUF308 family)
MSNTSTMPLTGFDDDLLGDRLRKSSGWMLWLGLAMVGLGIAAIIYPNVSTSAAELFVGWMLLLSGILLFFGSFSISGTGPFFGSLLLSLLSVAAGVFLLVNQAAGAVALTLLVGGLFVFQGASEIVLALAMRSFPGWVGLLISGIASVVLAVLIATGWPANSAIVLGILFGVNFISTGIAYVMISRAKKS